MGLINYILLSNCLGERFSTCFDSRQPKIFYKNITAFYSRVSLLIFILHNFSFLWLSVTQNYTYIILLYIDKKKKTFNIYN